MKKTSFSVALLLLLLPVTGLAGDPMIGRDLAFAQIAVGGGYETVLNLTNRGTTTYAGTFSLFRQSGQAWSPLINGNAINNGKLDISLSPGATTTLKLTTSGTTEAGFGTIKASNSNNTSFLEGTLTYFVKTGETVVDSIGVQPSNDIYLVTIPFDNFGSIALALANAKATPATVGLRLWSEKNNPVGTPIPPLQLKQNEHVAKYLWQLFPDVQMTAGRLEIQSDVPILGTALTDAGGQFSSLPFLPALKAYDYTLTLPGFSGAGVGSLRINGAVVEFCGLDQSDPNDPIYWVGTLLDDKLEFDIYDSVDQVFLRMTFSPFSIYAKTMVGTIKAWSLNPPLSYMGEGTVSITAIN